jgi:DNA-binding GntR family transcriptional regulator
MPSIRQAREVFETRRILEGAIVRQVALTITRSQIDELGAIASQEDDARRLHDAQAVIKLSGEFHRRLASLAENHTMSAIMHELTALTCLVIMLYGNATLSACATDEHRSLLEALEEHDAQTAAARLLAHLDHVEAELTLVPPATDDADFESIFSA